MTMPLDPQTIDTPGVRRRYFGTDGVRGVVGKELTPELVERLGRAATLWAGPGSRVFIGRDTRGSGPELEQAFARGVVAAGGRDAARERLLELGPGAARVAADEDAATV